MLIKVRLQAIENIPTKKYILTKRNSSCYTSNITAVTLENYYLESQEYQSFLATVEENWKGCPADITKIRLLIISFERLAFQ